MLYSTQEPLQHFPITRDTVKASSTSRVLDPTPFPYTPFAVCSLSLPGIPNQLSFIPYCRPTRASVLSGHIDSVSRRCHYMPRPTALAASRYLAVSLLPTRPTVSRRSYPFSIPLARQYRIGVSLPLTKPGLLFSLYASSSCPLMALGAPFECMP